MNPIRSVNRKCFMEFWNSNVFGIVFKMLQNFNLTIRSVCSKNFESDVSMLVQIPSQPDKSEPSMPKFVYDFELASDHITQVNRVMPTGSVHTHVLDVVESWPLKHRPSGA